MSNLVKAMEIVNSCFPNEDGYYEIAIADMAIIREVIKSEYDFEYPEDTDEEVHDDHAMRYYEYMDAEMPEDFEVKEKA